VALLIAVGLAAPAAARTTRCAPDAVLVGATCVDRWEASTWQIPADNLALVRKVQRGRATLDDLLSGGAVQVSAGGFVTCVAPLYPATFPFTGNWTAPIYAVSVPGVLPSGCTSWFQAAQACALSGKRLLSNVEWQEAAAGTPDPGFDDNATTCKITNDPEGSNPAPTGSRAACVSQWGVFDMVGNIYEWVGDWSERPTSCSTWPVAFGDDYACMGGNGTVPLPTALARGGYFGLVGGTLAGQYAVVAINTPGVGAQGNGFRCGQ
jgi:formylglycine-generating enzyme required for sulfatase activity